MWHSSFGLEIADFRRYVSSKFFLINSIENIFLDNFDYKWIFCIKKIQEENYWNNWKCTILMFHPGH